MHRRIVSAASALAVAGTLLAPSGNGTSPASAQVIESVGLSHTGAGPGATGTVRFTPDGTDEVYVDLRGGAGGRVIDGVPGGRGGRVTGLVEIPAGSRLELYSGVEGNAGHQHSGGEGMQGAGDGGSALAANGGRGGGSGGGSADLRVGTNAGLDARVVVAGGGGGGGGSHAATLSGRGGLGSGADGTAGTCGTNPGAGGTTTAPGAGGIGVGGGEDGGVGAANVGGAGGGSTAVSGEGGGGGGAGVFGGGGGGGNAGAGAGCGGGGSGFAPSGTLSQTGVSASPLVYLYWCVDPCTPTFEDVDEDHPFFWEIELAALHGVARGYDDGGFHPSASVSRQAMAGFLFNQQRIDPEDYQPPATPTFSDVSPNHPFYAQIEWMHEEGYADGYADGTYRPSAPVTRQSMSAFLFRLSGQDDLFTAPGEASFSDVATHHRFNEAIEWMSSVTVTTGYDDGTFQPSAPVTRQAMAAFIFRYQPFIRYS